MEEEVEEVAVEEEHEDEAVEEEVEEEEEYDHRTIILREAFDAYDTDKNGTMNTAEIGDLCESLGIYLKKEEVEVIMKLVDVDESGNICKKEFIDLMNTEEMSQWETWLDLFMKYDTDQSGTITMKEIQMVLKERGREIPQMILDHLLVEGDQNDNRTFDYKEFVEVMGKSKWKNYLGHD